MSTDTIKTQRRKVRYDSMDELLADARRLATANPTMVGGWTLAENFHHLASVINMSVDGGWVAPAPLRWILRPLLKRRFLTRSLPAGFKVPKQLPNAVPPEDSNTEEALDALGKAIERFRAEPQRAIHPFIGKLTPAEWEQFHCRHAELHLSHAVG